MLALIDQRMIGVYTMLILDNTSRKTWEVMNLPMTNNSLQIKRMILYARFWNLQRCCKNVMNTCEVFCKNDGLTIKVQGFIVDLYVKYKLKQPRENGHTELQGFVSHPW